MEKQLIYAAILAVMKEVEPISKDRTNTQQNYKFRGVDDLMNAISPILSKHGVFPTVLSIADKANDPVTSKSGGQGWRLVRRYTFRFYAEDGSYVDTAADGEAIDYGDKASNKAYSVAYREAMFKMFVIPFQGEDIEEASHDIAAKPAAPAARTTAPAAKPVPPTNIAKQRDAAAKRIAKLLDEVYGVPFMSAQEYKDAALAETGLELKDENFAQIERKLEEIKAAK